MEMADEAAVMEGDRLGFAGGATCREEDRREDARGMVDTSDAAKGVHINRIAIVHDSRGDVRASHIIELKD